MAHELGHIIIPWHIGTLIADNANSFVIPESIYEASQAYWGIENEANRFAAELLMPRDWVLEQINELPDLARLHEVVTLHCGVSPQAAAYRLESFLPPHIVYCAEDSMVQYSGRTIGTHAYALTKGEMFLEEFIPNCYFPYCKAKFSWRLGGTTFHWWILPSIIEVAPDDNRNWREVLENIIMDINPPPGEIDFRLSVNGIIAAANGELKRAKTTKYSVESLIAISFQRFHNRDELANFIAHPDFKVYVQKRAIELVRKPEKRKRRSK
ncbi:hypothetical protein ASU33_03100 [Solirubrum puertoriconensis]|uniref:IrrE N-terminal-like domain-containing protein n=2 Tax=Solirubrum puertoriconensis TaxID=1751427 RepID=A0A9X0HI79_SOLP1|nr:hypothetical protein ASU33_03100 [Solirubrum puertoriconensis]